MQGRTTLADEFFGLAALLLECHQSESRRPEVDLLDTPAGGAQPPLTVDEQLHPDREAVFWRGTELLQVQSYRRVEPPIKSHKRTDILGCAFLAR